jgi:FMN reductase
VRARPTYRGSLTGALKNLLDHLPVGALRGKPTASPRSARPTTTSSAPNHHLRDILTSFGAATTPTSLYPTSRDFEDGVPSEAVITRTGELLDTLLLYTGRLGGEPLGPPPIGR